MTTISPLTLRIDAEFKAERRRRIIRAVIDVLAVLAVSLVITWAMVTVIAGVGP